MSAAPVRSFTLLAAAIVVAAIIVSAALFVAPRTAATVTKTSTSTEFGTSTLTSTLTSTSTIVSTSTVTAACNEGTVDAVNTLEPRAASTFEPLSGYNFTTDCQLGITLGLSANAGIVTGTNESITVSLANDAPASRDVNYTSFPPLHGLDSSSAAWYDYVLPLQPPCGYPSISSFEPAFIAVYNNAGSPMQLSGSPMPMLPCISSGGGQYHPFTASQAINESVSIGGYWTSQDAEEPWVNATYSQFSPGNYAIVAFDPWGQATELNFTVNPSGTTSTSTECTISAEGTGFYVAVLSDSGQAVQGAQVTGTRVTEVGSSACQQDIGTYVTNSTGSVLITPNIGSYYQLSIAYQGSDYTVKAPIVPMETTYVTMRVPSGNVTISEVFEGGCQTSSGGVSCPG
jgi:hypothetical protein